MKPNNCMEEKHKVSKVEFIAVKDLPKSTEQKFDKPFVEIRIENSVPTIKIENVESPAKKVKELLTTAGIKIDF